MRFHWYSQELCWYWGYPDCDTPLNVCKPKNNLWDCHRLSAFLATPPATFPRGVVDRIALMLSLQAYAICPGSVWVGKPWTTWIAIIMSFILQSETTMIEQSINHWYFASVGHSCLSQPVPPNSKHMRDMHVLLATTAYLPWISLRVRFWIAVSITSTAGDRIIMHYCGDQIKKTLRSLFTSHLLTMKMWG